MAGKPEFDRFAVDEDGGMTVFMILWMIIFFILGGVAVESSGAWRTKAELQSAADAAALAAIIDVDNQATALNEANDFAEANMPSSMHGDVLPDSEVVFGNWDGGGFTPEASGGTPVNAVQTTTFRTAANNNGLRSTMLRLTGFVGWDISARAIAARFKQGTCLTYENVIMADGQIHLNPGSTYAGEICVHSNDHIRPQPDVTWGPGTYASMPDDGFDSIYDAFNHHNPQISSSWDPENMEYTKGPGLYEALEGNNGVSLLSDNVSGMVSSIYAGETTYLPSGASISDTQTIEVGTDEIPQTLTPGTQYNFDCGGLSSLSSVAPSGAVDFAGSLFEGLFAAHAAKGGKKDDGDAGGGGITASQNQITFDLDLDNVVIVTDCSVKIHGGSYTNTLFATTASNQAVQFAHNDTVQIGADDNCAPGGDTHFIAPNGDIHSAAKANFFDAKFIGGKDYHLAAQSKGETATGKAVGINVQVAGEAHITALAGFTGCGDADGEEYANWGFRLVR